MSSTDATSVVSAQATAHGSRVAAPYGEWDSPITSVSLTTSAVRLSALHLAQDGQLFWLEERPQDAGRCALVTAHISSSDAHVDVIPSDATGSVPFNVRTRVSEYGGGAYIYDSVSRRVFFSNFSDQRVYAVDTNAEAGTAEAAPRAITAEGTGAMYADYVVDSRRQQLICVRETHSEHRESISEIVSIDANSGAETVLVTGSDFYAAPRLSADGGRLAYMAWDHPSMPWGSTGVYVGTILIRNNVISLTDVVCVAGGKLLGGDGAVAVMQPTWNGNDLYYISDTSRWWALYRWTESSSADQLIFGAVGTEVGSPQWLFGAQAFSFFSSGDECVSNKVVVQYLNVNKPGSQLTVVDLTTGDRTDLSVPFTFIACVQLAPSLDSRNNMIEFACIAGSSTSLSRVAISKLDLSSMSVFPEWITVKLSSSLSVDISYLSEPQVLEFPTGNDGESAYMYYYAPKSGRHEGPADGSKPLLLVKSHGGPTSSASAAYQASIQYMTSRGIAVADINYGGSSGYGTAYRNRLNGKWGIVDVQDCCAAALYLADRGYVDRTRLIVSGGSAGGYTTLACLAFRPDVFAAGASLYGIGDLNLLAATTHKFESRYLHSLVGKYPEDKTLYDARSPVNSARNIRAPLVLFQGLEDKIVPPSQAEAMHKALRGNGVKTAYVTFKGEQHGFRSSQAQRRSIDGELYFYGRVLGFSPKLGVEDFEPFAID
jgi:dienelactone hydrolase